MSFLSLLGAAIPWRVIGIGAGALAICGAVWFVFAQATSIGRLKAERDAAIASAATNADLLRSFRDENARIQAAAGHANTLKALSRRELDAQRKEIYEALQSDDGALAPVLRRQLDELPERISTNDLHSATATGGPAGAAVAH